MVIGDLKVFVYGIGSVTLKVEFLTKKSELLSLFLREMSHTSGMLI